MALRRGLGHLGRYPALGAFLIYLVASLVLFGRPLVHDPSHTCLCIGNTTDEGTIAWALQWWPHALLHGLNPFHPKIIYAPQGIDVAQGALMPGLSLLAAPVTAIAGPLQSYDIAALLAPVLAAWFAFLLCRRLTDRFWPSLVGGWLFGFSSYMLGEQVGHLNLTFVFLVPAIVHLTVKALAGELTRRRYIVLLAIALIAQFSFSTEVFATFTVFAVVALIAGWLLGDAETKTAIGNVLIPIGIAYGAALVIVSPYLYYVLQPGGSPVDVPRAEMFSNDLLGFVVPSATARIGGVHFAKTSLGFTGGFVEANAYLGIPLLIVLAWSIRAGWRSRVTRTATAMLAIIALCSLGARLHVNGDKTIPLPWDAVQHLPLLGIALPGRFNMYIALIVGVLAALVLARYQARTPATAVSWLLAAAAVATLWPSNLPFWHSKPELPAFFTDGGWRKAIGPRDVALVLPVGIEGNSMLWQAETKLGFTMASGYVVAPNAPDPYSKSPVHPTLTYGYTVANEQQRAAAFIASHHITVAVISASPNVNAAPWAKILRGLGWKPVLDQGTVVFRPPGAA